MNNRICPGEELLSEYLSGCLPEAEKKDIERHIAGCGECRRLVAETHEVARMRGFSDIKKTFLKWIKKNRWFAGALAAFISSFFFPKYFLQLLVACLLMGAKWIVEAKSTKMLIMIHEAWKRGDDETADKIFSRFDPK